MKRMIKFLANSIMMLCFVSSIYGQATATAVSTATILTPIAISKTADLNFGNLAVNTSPGTLAISTAAVLTPGGGVTDMPGIAPTAAAFTVTGFPGAVYTIALPVSVVLTDGTNNITVDTFVSNPSGTGTLTGGTSNLLVGATLNVPASSPAGVYTNAAGLSVTVNYQ